ncbi:MAG TPA: ribonuclease E inhibitor RraB [Saprospiraceae bacterium]|nr:ribonuclease E inhibitor RraB [Saprospiraceae bacterium]
MKHKNNKEGQSEATSVTVSYLLNFGVKCGDQRSLEFFFYTSDKDKAIKLSDILQKEYGYEIYKLHKTLDKWAVIGLTTPQPILTEMVQEWAEEMCKLGDRYECEFDGWGTLA